MFRDEDAIIDLVDDMDIIKEWKGLKDIIDKNPTVRPITIEAWDRCEKLNVDPSNLKFTYLSEQELEQKLLDNDVLIQVARPYLEYLSLSLSGIPHVVALLDSEGWVLDIKGTADELGGKDKGLCKGASWKEEHIGNNGGGTSLTTKKPVFIYGHEHIANIYKPFSCLGVPIHIGNKLIGTIDVSVLNEYAYPGRLTITMACVDAIEREITKKYKKRKGIKNTKKMIATSELMATAVHDLKNPLASIRGLAQLGILTSASKKEQSYFDRIIKQVDSLNNSVVDLQNVFKPEETNKANPTEVIREVLSEIQPTCEIHKIKLCFSTNFEGEVNLHVKQFKRAIENLIKNAIQVLPNDGIIEVNVNHDGKRLLVSVNDNGPGIPDDIRKQIFEPFVYHRKDGTGLGLFMVHHVITEVHGGEIRFESELGKGTTFYISLPIR